MADTWLYLDHPYMCGAAVRRWQEILDALKYDIGRYGPDGIFGKDTDVATRKFQEDAGLSVDGIVGSKTMAAAQARLDNSVVSPENVSPAIISGVEVWDYRKAGLSAPKHGLNARTWPEITGLMLHRTACVLGESPQRYWPVNAHVGVTLGGRLILTFPWEPLIWHGQGPSRWTIGIEFDGNPEGKPGYWWKSGGPVNPITDAQVKASEVLLALFMAEFSAHGQRIEYIVAHRQSSKDRECDPGHECWKKIAIPWMERTGAIPGPREGHPVTEGLVEPVGYAGDTWSDGAQIPREWDPRSSIPFWK